MQERRVVCVSAYTGLVANDEYCVAERIPRPDDDIRGCNAHCQLRSEMAVVTLCRREIVYRIVIGLLHVA